jgi:hypothetical protein
MNITELTPQQLRQAAAIKEKIESLNKELRTLADAATANGTTPKKPTTSAAVRKRIAAAPRARWSKIRRSRP